MTARREAWSLDRFVSVSFGSMSRRGRALVARSSCLGDTLIERFGMTAEQVDALNRQVQGFRDALVAHPEVRP
jgi:hypothetical protein